MSTPTLAARFGSWALQPDGLWLNNDGALGWSQVTGAAVSGDVLGSAEMEASATVGTVLSTLGALAVPLPSTPATGINIRVKIPWVLAGGVSPLFVAVAILEDTTIINYSPINLAANGQVPIEAERLAWAPTAGAHTYSVQMQTGASTVTVFAQKPGPPIVIPTLVVEAA